VFSVDPQMWVREENLYLRFEDTVVVTETGVENFTDFIPMELAHQLIQIWSPRGVDSALVMALTGSQATHPLPQQGLHLPEATAYEPEPSEAAVIAALAPDAKRADLWQNHSAALDLAGILPGDVLVVDIGDVRALPGEIVCAQVYRRTGDDAETVFRIYEPPFLVARSSDRRFTKPLLMDGENVSVRGRVRASFRRHLQWSAAE